MGHFGVKFLEDGAAESWFDSYLLEYVRAWRLHDDALPCLDALDVAGIRIGMITNGDRTFQQAKLDAMGLDGRIEHLVTSGEFGIAKPDPSIFAHACAGFGVHPAQAMYIGDRLPTDAIGAADAGLSGVWLNRSGETDAAQTAAIAASGVAMIRGLAELPQLLGRL